MSYFGARCFGTDIDMRVLMGSMYAGKRPPVGSADIQLNKHSIWENFEQYGLEKPEIIRVDNHLFSRHYGSSLHNFFDAIVTDPPYGIRAGGISMSWH